MADAASVSIQATVLPDEIAKTFAGTITVTPDDANDKWYYKLTSVTTTSADLIAGNFTDYTAVDQDTAPTAVNTSDKVKFLFIQNTSTTDGIVICLDGGTDIGAALTSSDLIIVDDVAGGTNRKATLARLLTLTDGNATALAIALG